MKNRLFINMAMASIFCLISSQNTTAIFEEYNTYETIGEKSSSESSREETSPPHNLQQSSTEQNKDKVHNQDSRKSSANESSGSSSSTESIESTPTEEYSDEITDKWQLFNLCSRKTVDKKQIARIKEALTHNSFFFPSKDMRRNQERTLLHTVIFHQNTKLIKLFIENFLADPQNNRPGFDVDVKDLNKLTPLDYAIGNHDEKTVKLLLTHGAHPNNQDNADQSTPLHSIAINLTTHGAEKLAINKSSFLKITRLLKEHGANPTLKNTRGETPRMIIEKTHKLYHPGKPQGFHNQLTKILEEWDKIFPSEE